MEKWEKDTFRELVKFLIGAKDDLYGLGEELSFLDKRLCAITIEDWLSSRHRMKNKSPKKFPKECTFRENIKFMVERCEQLSGYFIYKDNTLDFKETIDEETRSAIRKYMYDNYKPPLRT